MEAAMRSFAVKLNKAIKEDMERLLPLMEGEAVYGIALVADSFLESLYIAINTEESLAALMSETEAKYGEIAPMDRLKLRWQPEAWVYNSSNLQFPAMLELNQFLVNKTVEDFNGFEMLFYETVLDEMTKLDRNGVFGEMETRVDRIIFLTIEGDSRRVSIENFFASQLNSEAQFAEFMARFELTSQK